MTTSSPGVAWHRSEIGAPVLDDAVAQVHCTPEQEIEAGDHYIVLCRVQGLEVARPVTPLLFFQGGYGGFSPAGMAARGDADLIAALRLTDTARHEVERLAQRLRCEAAVLVGVGPDELTTAFSAYGGTAEMVEPLGQRIPLIPPIGEAYVAGAAPEVVEHWLSKVNPKDPELVEQYRTRLASVERRGAGISFLGGDGPVEYEQLGEALREYGTGELTPAREREFRSLLAKHHVLLPGPRPRAHRGLPRRRHRRARAQPRGRHLDGPARHPAAGARRPGAQVEEWIATRPAGGPRGRAAARRGRSGRAARLPRLVRRRLPDVSPARLPHAQNRPGGAPPGRFCVGRQSASGCMMPGGRFLASGSSLWPQMAVWL